MTKQTIDDGYAPDFPRPTATDGIQDIHELAFWNVDCRILKNTDISAEADTWDRNRVDVLTPPPPPKDNHTVSDLVSNKAALNIWLASVSLAKSLYPTSSSMQQPSNISPRASHTCKT